MSTPFQNRLVGTVIVAAVAIIFLPDILDGEKTTYQEQFEQVPEAPSIDFTPQNNTLPKEKLERLTDETLSDEIAVDDEDYTKKDELSSQNTPVETVEDSKSPDAEKDNVATTSKDSVKRQMPEKVELEKAWVIQLGSFRHKKNVAELERKLKTAGYTVFTRPIKTKNGTLTKVFVGPELHKSSLEKKIPALKELTKVQGKVARFQPTK